MICCYLLCMLLGVPCAVCLHGFSIFFEPLSVLLLLFRMSIPIGQGPGYFLLSVILIILLVVLLNLLGMRRLVSPAIPFLSSA